MPALFRVAAALAFAACAVAPSDMPPQPPGGAPAAARPLGVPTRILSAHAQPPPTGDEREYFGVPVGTLVYLVFTRPLDPAALIPGRFVVLARDGTRRVPIAASLAPASERDELRALELVIPAPQRELVSVTVAGQLFDADGRDLDGQSADVVAADAPPFPVAAELVSQGTDCPAQPGAGAPAAVRVVERPGRRGDRGRAPLAGRRSRPPAARRRRRRLHPRAAARRGRARVRPRGRQRPRLLHPGGRRHRARRARPWRRARPRRQPQRRRLATTFAHVLGNMSLSP
ncbi:hypothetical protein OV079_38055 [Nannocystis pusilla]|uniref:Lipoprotein n=1 Tax=Nannocystis pusilla TaxID=889268 RepID=A0A9X3EW98_9BACT|nr:hypothetical protein [Nannocystis pusilla]MCY1011266.1 hypothetical protein [Nannocystis pusilla]